MYEQHGRYIDLPDPYPFPSCHIEVSDTPSMYRVIYIVFVFALNFQCGGYFVQ